ncbi:MAG: PilZ domain-containing protein [Pseudomonadales bacterium]
MSTVDSTADDKRAFIRMKLDSSVVLEPTAGSETYEGMCKDISGVGLLVATEAPLEQGDKLTVRIKPLDAKSSEFSASATVNRITNSNGERLLALSIDEIFD